MHYVQSLERSCNWNAQINKIFLCWLLWLSWWPLAAAVCQLLLGQRLKPCTPCQVDLLLQNSQIVVEIGESLVRIAPAFTTLNWTHRSNCSHRANRTETGKYHSNYPCYQSRLKRPAFLFIIFLLKETAGVFTKYLQPILSLYGQGIPYQFYIYIV